MLVNESWRERLLAAIEASDVSERQIGIRAGVGQSWVSDFKNMGKPPRLETFLKVCQFLGVSPAHILTGLPVTPETEAILRGLASLTPRQRHQLQDYIRSLIEDDEPRLLP